MWDKRVKSISLDWMKMLYNKSTIINVKMISKKPKSMFKYIQHDAIAIPKNQIKIHCREKEREWMPFIFRSSVA